MWQIKFHRLVIEYDLFKFTDSEQENLLKQIHKKLAVNPEAYGKPLQGPLKGYWRLRINDFRVVYKILKDEIVVVIVKIGYRKDDSVYRELFTRIKKL